MRKYNDDELLTPEELKVRLQVVVDETTEELKKRLIEKRKQAENNNFVICA